MKEGDLAVIKTTGEEVCILSVSPDGDCLVRVPRSSTASGIVHYTIVLRPFELESRLDNFKREFGFVQARDLYLKSMKLEESPAPAAQHSVN